MNQKQIVRIFKKNYYADKDTDDQCNTFLKEHPNYNIDKISHTTGTGCTESLCVVFNINEIKGEN